MKKRTKKLLLLKGSCRQTAAFTSLNDKVFWSFFSKKDCFLRFAVPTLLTLTLGAALSAHTALASTMCRGDAGQGKFFFALGAEVFAVPGSDAILEQSPPAGIVNLEGGGVVAPVPRRSTMPIAPPEPSDDRGCLNNPVQLVLVVVDLGAIVPGDGKSTIAGKLDLSLSTAVGNGARSGGFREVGPDAGERARQAEEDRYVAAQEAYCASPAGQAELGLNPSACFYKLFGKPKGGWTGNYTFGRDPHHKDPFAVGFFCQPDTARVSWTRCVAQYRLKVERGLPWTWIDLQYGVNINAPSRKALVDLLLEFDFRVRLALSAADITDYPWPPASLGSWKAAQPTLASVAKHGTLISSPH